MSLKFNLTRFRKGVIVLDTSLSMNFKKMPKKYQKIAQICQKHKKKFISRDIRERLKGQRTLSYMSKTTHNYLTR